MAISQPTRLARIAGLGAVLALASWVPAMATPGATQSLTPEQGAVAVTGLSILADSPEYGVGFGRTINPFLGEQEPSGDAFSAGRANIQLGNDIEGLDDVDLDDVYFFTSIEDPFAIDGDSLLVTVEAPAEAIRGQFLDVALLVEQVAQPVAGADPNLELDPNEGFNTRASVSVTDGDPGTRYEQFVEGEWREFQMPFDAWVVPTEDTAVIGLLAPARFIAGAPNIEIHVSGFPLDSSDTADIFVHRTGNIVSTQIPILDAVILDPVRPAVEEIISAADLSTLTAAAGALPGGSGDDDLSQIEPEPTTTPVPSTTSPPATTEAPAPTEPPATTTPPATAAPDATETNTGNASDEADGGGGSVLPILIILVIAFGVVAVLLWLLLWRPRNSDAGDAGGGDAGQVLSGIEAEMAAAEAEAEYEYQLALHRNRETMEVLVRGIIGSAEAAGHPIGADGVMRFSPAEFERHFVTVGGYLRLQGRDLVRVTTVEGHVPIIDEDGSWVGSIDPADCVRIDIDTNTRKITPIRPESSEPIDMDFDFGPS